MKVGDIYGELVIEDLFTKGKYPAAKVKCSCGLVKEVFQSNLRSGATTSCGEHKKPKPGNRYGYLTVLKVFRNEKKYEKALCKCECGNTREVYANSLRAGRATSCGCARRKSL